MQNRIQNDAWAAATNVLAVRLDSLGDVLMTEPALRALKEAAAGRRLTLLTSPSGAAVAELLPCVDQTIVYSAPWMKVSPEVVGLQHDEHLKAVLKQQQFDGAVIFTCFSQSALPAAMLCYQAGIPLRAAHVRENPYHLLTHWINDTEPQSGIRHETQRQLDLVTALGATVFDLQLKLTVPASARQSLSEKLAEEGFKPDCAPWAVLHAGASAVSRRYPPEMFAEVAQGLISELGLTVVFTGSEFEQPLIREIRGRLGSGAVLTLSLAGQLSLAELAALIEAAPLVICNNTGPAHIAAAVGTPVVVLYALTNPQHTPWMARSRVLTNPTPCGYCYKSICPEGHHQCLHGIAPNQVLRAAQDLLAASSSALTDHRPPTTNHSCSH